jgi:hypothetical protein
MKYKLIYAIFFLSIFTLLGCGAKTKFKKIEFKWFDVYNKNDTLIFKSDKGEFDTSIIIKKELFYPKYNPIEESGTYLSQWGVIWYKNKNLEYHPDGYRLVTIEKKSPNETFLNINYLYSSILILNIKSGTIEKYKQGKIYEFDTYNEKGKSYQPKKIFWHEKYGIIKYVTHGNVTWERINLPNADNR